MLNVITKYQKLIWMVIAIVNGCFVGGVATAAPEKAIQNEIFWGKTAQKGSDLLLTTDPFFKKKVTKVKVDGRWYSWYAIKEGVYHWRLTQAHRELARGSFVSVFPRTQDNQGIRLSWKARSDAKRYLIRVHQPGVRTRYYETSQTNIVLERPTAETMYVVIPLLQTKTKNHGVSWNTRLKIANEPNWSGKSNGVVQPVNPNSLKEWDLIAGGPASGAVYKSSAKPSKVTAPALGRKVKHRHAAVNRVVKKQEWAAMASKAKLSQKSGKYRPKAVKRKAPMPRSFPKKTVAQKNGRLTLANRPQEKTYSRNPIIENNDGDTYIVPSFLYELETIESSKAEVALGSERFSMGAAANFGWRLTGPFWIMGDMSYRSSPHGINVEGPLGAGESEILVKRGHGSLLAGIDLNRTFGWIGAEHRFIPAVGTNWSLIPALPLQFNSFLQTEPIPEQKYAVMPGAHIGYEFKPSFAWRLNIAASAYSITKQMNRGTTEGTVEELKANVGGNIDFLTWSAGVFNRKTKIKECHEEVSICDREGKVNSGVTETGLTVGLGTWFN